LNLASVVEKKNQLGKQINKLGQISFFFCQPIFFPASERGKRGKKIDPGLRAILNLVGDSYK